MVEDFASLPTESANPSTSDLDRLSTLEMMVRMNSEDARVALAVLAALPEITAAVDVITRRTCQGGR